VTGTTAGRPTVTHLHKATHSPYGECNAGGVFTAPNLKLTDDPAQVTCRSCQRTRRYRELTAP
jgi:hypothetical protein